MSHFLYFSSVIILYNIHRFWGTELYILPLFHIKILGEIFSLAESYELK